MRKPNLFIIGAAKSGTTSLFNYLKEHPDIFGSSIKEPDFFNWDSFKELNCSKAMFKKIIKTEEKYLSLFNGAANEKYLMDGSIFTMCFRESMLRLKDFCDDRKAIIIIRNPMDRFMSHYSMQIYGKEETRKLKEFLLNPVSREGISLLEMGLYSRQISNALEILGRENVHIILFDDFKRDTGKCLREVYGFLNIENLNISAINEVHNKSRGLVKNNIARILFGYLEKFWIKLGNPENKFFRVLKNFARRIAFKSNKPNEDIKKYLYDYYKDDIEKTESITDFDLSNWKN